MIFKIKSTFDSINTFRIGHISFLIGVFFIGSALPIGIIFLLFSSILTFYKKRNLFLLDRWNYPFIFCSLLMLLSASNNSIGNNIFAKEGFQISSIWLDTLNWIPLFYISWGFQPYIESKKQKVLFAKVLIAGSIPILLSCALQYWFGVYGPFKTLFNSIIWFQKPINDSSGISGLFSNPNYLGSWIVVILPFTFYFIAKQKKYPQRFVPIIILILNIYFLSQTNSRNALLNFFSSIFIIIGFKKSLIITTSIVLISFFMFYFLNLIFLNNQFIRNLLPFDLFYKSTYLKNFPRIEVWQKGIGFIKEKPIFGWGAGTFYLLFISRGGTWNSQHLHNLPLDMAYKYGILVSAILTVSILIILSKSLKNTYNKDNKITIDRCWCAASFAILFFQINDVTYFDGKISIIIWILLSGLREINKNHNSKIFDIKK